MTNHHLDQDLKRLRMPGILANYAMRAREAQESDLGYIKFLSLLIQDEMISRESNNLEKRLRSAGFSFGSTFEEFDFGFNREALPAAMVRDLATCNFIHKAQNLVICGPPGIGKSHIAQAIGHEACRRQMDVLFRKTSKLIKQLSDSLYPKRVIRLMKKAVSCNLLILDDFAFSPHFSPV